MLVAHRVLRLAGDRAPQAFVVRSTRRPLTAPMTPLLLSTMLLAAAPDGERLLSNEVAAGLGFLGSGYTVNGGRMGDALLAPSVTGRGVFSGFTVDGALLVGAPLAPNGEAVSVTGTVRAGYTGYRWSVLGGVSGQWAHSATPAMQWMPSLRGQVDFGSFGLSAGLFDFHGQVPFHLSAELGRFSIGYVAPIGLVASADIPLTQSLSLRCQGWVYRLFNSEQVLVTVGAVWGGGK